MPSSVCISDVFTVQDGGVGRVYVVKSIPRPRSVRLLLGDAAGLSTEVVLRVQGSLCRKSLPPVTKPYRV